MPKCTGCGNEIPAAARFCAVCGQQSGPAAPAARPTPGSPTPGPSYGVEAAPNNNTRTAAIAGGVLLLVALGLLALKMSGILGAKPTQAPAAAVLNAPITQVANAPVLNAPPVAAPSAPVIQAPGVPGVPMPADVIDYLRWLKAFEGARHNLEGKSEGQMEVVLAETAKNAMTGGADSGLLNGDPTETNSNGTAAPKSSFDFHAIDQMIGQWNQVTGLFQQKTPPNPCAQLAISYNSGLSDSVRMMSKLMGVLRSTLAKESSPNGAASTDIMSVVSDLKADENSKGSSKSIDGLYADANANLDAVRSQYTQIPSDIDAQHFDIKEGGGSGGGLGLGM